MHGVDTPERGESSSDIATAFTKSRVEGRTIWLERMGTILTDTEG